MTLRLIFMGTPDFAVPSLDALRAAGHEIVCVYTQPPRPAGRGQKERPSPVQRAATAHNIPVRAPKTLKDPEEHQAFTALGADAAVVAAYGLILPKPVLDAPRLGCLNVHASLLPRWRGAAPIQRAILAGDRQTGVTIMQMDAGLDTGPMILRREMKIGSTMTAGALHDALAKLGGEMIVEALVGLDAGTLSASPQPPKRGVKYAAKTSKSEARIDWQKMAGESKRLVRAFSPSPGAWFEIGGQRIRVLKAKAIGCETKSPPGTVWDDKLTIVSGCSLFQPLVVQRDGKAPMDTESFLRGFPIPKGTVLESPRPAT